MLCSSTVSAVAALPSDDTKQPQARRTGPGLQKAPPEYPQRPPTSYASTNRRVSCAPSSVLLCSLLARMNARLRCMLLCMITVMCANDASTGSAGGWEGSERMGGL